MFVISRLLRIWHEKLSERCLNGTTKRGSSKGRWNHKAQQGGYATCDAEGISQIGVGIHEIRGFWPSKEKKVVSLHGSLHSMDHFWSLINNSFFFPAMRLIHAFKFILLIWMCRTLRMLCMRSDLLFLPASWVLMKNGTGNSAAYQCSL